MEQITIATIGTPEVHEGTKGTGTSAGKIVTLETQQGQANIKLLVIRPVFALAVGFAHGYFEAFTGLLAIAGFVPGAAELLSNGGNLYAALPVCFKMAFAPPIVGLIKSLASYFGELRNKFPLLTGSLS